MIRFNLQSWLNDDIISCQGFQENARLNPLSETFIWIADSEKNLLTSILK